MCERSDVFALAECIQPAEKAMKTSGFSVYNLMHPGEYIALHDKWMANKHALDVSM